MATSGAIRQLLGPLKKRIEDRTKEAKTLLGIKLDAEPEVCTIQDQSKKLKKVHLKLKEFKLQLEELYYKFIEVEEDKEKLEEETGKIAEVLLNTTEVVEELFLQIKDIEQHDVEGNELRSIESGLTAVKLEMGKMKLQHTQEMEKIQAQMKLRHDQEMEKIKLSHEQEVEQIKLKLELEVKKIQNQKDLAKTPESDQNVIKLPKLDFEKFSGDILRWQEFWDAFDSAIHSNKRLRNVDKLNYLHTKLEGSAKQVIAGLALTNENYEVAIRLLKARFANKRKVVNARYESIISLAPSSNDPESLRETFDTLEVHLRALEAIGEDIKNNLMLFIIWTKLPMEAKIRLEERLEETDWNMESLRKEIDIYINARWENISISSEVNSLQSLTQKPASKSTAEALLINDMQIVKKRCIYCKLENHWSDQCKKYITIEQRKGVIKGRCYRCLMTAHPNQPCKIQRACIYCKKVNDHHRSLCPIQFVEEENGAPVKNMEANSENSLLATGERVIMQTATVSVRNQISKKSMPVRILLDSGSTRSYITEHLAEKLILQKIEKKTLSVYTFGSEKANEVRSSTVNADLIQHNGDLIPVKLDVVPKITGKMTRTAVDCEILKTSWKSVMSNLADTLPTENEYSSIEILLGNDYYWDVITGEKIEILPGLYFVNSKFGWIITGRTSNYDNDRPSADESSFLLITAKEVPDSYFISDLTTKITENMEMEHFWKLETIGIKEAIEQSDDDQALQIFNDTVKYKSGRYFVTWPWNCENPKLPDNYVLAENRLKFLMKRLQKQPEILQKYDNIIQDQLQKGVIEKVGDSNKEGSRNHYVPHHAVITPQKSTTKVRIVYDASAKLKKQKSLNECLYRGPVILEDLCLLLMRFRLWKIAVVADIEKAFLQVGLQEGDRDVTRFLWLKDPTKPVIKDNLEIFRFARVPFGMISSQFLLCATIVYHLKRIGTPTAQKIMENMYVDNVLCGMNSSKESESFYLEAKEIFDKASMNLREWASNSQEFLSNIRKHDKSVAEKIKVLGLQWHVKCDLLGVNDSYDATDTPLTKRLILKRIAAIFDPLGFFNPITVKAKLFLQSLWERNVGWDDELSEELFSQWVAINTDLSEIHGFQLQRYISYEEDCDYQLLCFSDASKLAYSAAVYLKISKGLKSKTHLIFSKTRVTPKKKISLPRLELLGVLIGVRCLIWIEEGLKLKLTSKHLWTDSQCVLRWMTSTKPLSVFVENRLEEIRSKPGICFHYINTHENPADLLTRGKSFTEINNCDLWWYGPSWLTKLASDWPKWDMPEITSDEVSRLESEVKRSTPMYEVSCFNKENNEANLRNCMPFELKPENYSSLEKLLRITAWAQRFVNKTRKKSSEIGPLNADEIAQAKHKWCLLVQRSEYSQLLTGNGNTLYNNMKKSLGLFQDERSIIRCFGRLHHSELSQEAKFPKLLPRKHAYTELVIQSYHRKLLHAGVSHTLAQVRNEFWIPQGRAEVRRILMKCLVCRRVDGGHYKLPSMPPYPAKRVTASAAFTFTGLDYLGPLYIKNENNRKVWVCLFTCLVVRAVHLELVMDMSAEQFLMSLRRFIARRGKPQEIISDNASQMKLTQKAISKAWKDSVNENDVENYVSKEEIKWKYITEHAPWMGGFYERLVQSVKKALKKAIGKNSLTYVQLETLLAEVEAVLNSRPLCYVGDDTDDGHVLTPNHFLSMNPKSGVTDVDVDTDDPEFQVKLNSVQQLLLTWKKGQNLLNNFWACWRNDYLSSLRERYQSKIKCSRIQSKDLIHSGDVVLIKDNLHRGSWRLGRVSDVVASFDGKVRAAKVRTSKGKMIQRPLNLLFPIEVSEDNVPQ